MWYKLTMNRVPVSVNFPRLALFPNKNRMYWPKTAVIRPSPISGN